VDDEMTLLELINANIGIAHKVCNAYFRDPADREDALQEMMYQLWKSYKSFSGASKFSTWMYSVCLRTVLTYRRKNKSARREPLSESHRQIADTSDKNREEMIVHLLNAIGTLPPLNRAIVLLYLEDLSYEEISEITGLSKSNVSVRLVRIKKELETKLKAKYESIEDFDL
jgi:RNA polymerase sigma-70 factor (ECF subfamily)